MRHVLPACIPTSSRRCPGRSAPCGKAKTWPLPSVPNPSPRHPPAAGIRTRTKPRRARTRHRGRCGTGARSTPGPVVWRPAPARSPVSPAGSHPPRCGRKGCRGAAAPQTSAGSAVRSISPLARLKRLRSPDPGNVPPSPRVSLGACAAQPAPPPPPPVPPFPVHSQGIGVQKLPAKPHTSASGTKQRQPQESPIRPPLGHSLPPFLLSFTSPSAPKTTRCRAPSAAPPCPHSGCSAPQILHPPTLWGGGRNPLTFTHGGGCPPVPYRAPITPGRSGHGAPTPPTL